MPESSRISGDTRQRIEKTLRAVLDESEEFHIEEATDGSNGFMQCTRGDPGCLQVEYSIYPEGEKQRFYRSVEDVPFEMAVELFTSYAAGQGNWKMRIEWEDWTEEFHKGSAGLGLIESIGLGSIVVILIGGFIWGFIDDWKESLELLGYDLLWILLIGCFFLISYICSRFWKHKFFWPNK